MDKILENIFKDAQKCAEIGKTLFCTSVKEFEGLDGIDINCLKERIKSESEGTLEIRGEINSYDKYIHLKIVES
jgi:hypothetical protein